jgi:hypothetical protein
MQDEVGDLTEYVRDKLRAANKAENDRTDGRRKSARPPQSAAYFTRKTQMVRGF